MQSPRQHLELSTPYADKKQCSQGFEKSEKLNCGLKHHPGLAWPRVTFTSGRQEQPGKDFEHQTEI